MTILVYQISKDFKNYVIQCLWEWKKMVLKLKVVRTFHWCNLSRGQAGITY